jgi:hypothetical protein
MTTLKIPPPAKTVIPAKAPAVAGPKQAQWNEAREVFPIYLALAKQLEFEIPFNNAQRNLPEKVELELFNKVQAWLDALDQRVLVYELRHLLQMTTLNASESGLRALIQRHLRKPSKSNVDRDKTDFLLVQYFALCAPPKIYHKQIEPSDVGAVMKTILGDIDPTPLAWCAPLEKMIQELRAFRSLRDILKTNFIEQGRKVKESAGPMFYEASALAAFIRFNFLLRRSFIELMHADLIAIRAGIGQLESSGVRIIDCHHFGLSASEPLSKIREVADEWKQPFQQEYTERSINQAFEKLLGLRTDIEKALEKVLSKSVPAKPAPAKSVATKNAAPAPLPTAKEPAADDVDPAGLLDFDACMEKIWEQLIATPPSRGRSMTTVKIGNARLLMSSWEVASFVSEDGPAAQDLRRAVVARALVTSSVEAAKETGNATSLDRALSIARIEVSRLQERVEVAKQAKDTEAAVNLGISTKRLLSSLDEAEKL